MYINFPSTPTDGQTYIVNDITYVYDATVGGWLIKNDQISGNLSVTETLSTNILNVDSYLVVASVNVIPAIQASFNAANTVPVGNTLSDSFTSRSTRKTLNFIPGTNITINVDDDSAGDRANIIISSSSTGGASVSVSNIAPGSPTEGNLWWDTDLGKLFIYYDDGTSAQWVEAGPGYAYIAAEVLAVLAFDKANSANLLAFNTGIGANAFTAATVAGANTAVGVGSNAFTSTTVAGANTAVGAGANAFSAATISGANTAVGTGANNYLTAIIAGANTAVGAGANAFASATVAGANVISQSAFAKANDALPNVSGISFNGSLNFPSGIVGIGTASPTANLQVNGSIFITRNNVSSLDAIGEIAEFAHNSNSYTQIHVRNANTGTRASADFVATSDTGTDASEFIDLGINNSNFNDPTWTVSVAKDGYLYTSNGNLAIGTANAGKSLVFFTGGTLAVNEDARFDPFGNLLIGKTTSTVGKETKLDVAGAINATDLLIVGDSIIDTIAGANNAVGAGANAYAASIAGGSAAFNAANNANVVAVSAFTKANAALPNVSGVTFDGNLHVSSNLKANIVNSLSGFIDLGPGSRPAYAEGRIYYDNVDKSLTVHNDTTFTYPIGQIEYARVWNDSGATLPKGAPVYATGYHNLSHHHFTVDLADASDPTKYDVIGLVAADIPTANHGYVIVRGWIGGINTATLTAGSRFHLGFASPGTLITTAPEYPNFPFDIGYCTVSDATNGYLYVDRQTHTLESLRVIGTGRVGGDFTVEGDFTVLGAENNITVNSLQVGTQFIYLGAGDSISNANVYFTGSGLDDLEFRGHYVGTGTTNFYVMISDVNPDKYSWSYLSNFTVLEQQNVAIQFQTTQLLSNGISVYFNANTGHTIGDKWNASATGVSTDFGFVGNHIDGPNGYTHAGLFRDATDGAFKFFNTYDPEVEGTINIGEATYSLANVEVLKVTGEQIYEGTMRLTDSMAANAIATEAAFTQANSAFLQANTARTAANNAYDKANSANSLAATVSINYVIDGGGSVISPGQKGHLEVPFNCRLNTWSILLDQTGSIQIQVWADTYANFPPTVADSINSVAYTVTSAVKAQGSVDSANSNIVAGEILAFNVVSATTTTRATIALKATKT